MFVSKTGSYFTAKCLPVNHDISQCFKIFGELFVFLKRPKVQPDNSLLRNGGV